MTDIVKRLRALHAPGCIRPTTLDFAADEIERLRNELQEVAGLMEQRAKRIRAMVPNAEVTGAL